MPNHRPAPARAILAGWLLVTVGTSALAGPDASSPSTAASGAGASVGASVFNAPSSAAGSGGGNAGAPAPSNSQALAAALLLGASDAAALVSTAAAAAQTTAPPAAFVAQVRDKASDMVITAMNFLGVPYRRGGNSAEAGFDCSGFTRQVFETSLGFMLPRRADEQAKAPGLVAVKRSELQPGDLVFFNTLKRTFSHVGIYIGEGKFIHAPKPGGEVRVESMSFAYWAKRFTGARRAEAGGESTATR